MWVIYKHTLLVSEHAGWSYIGLTGRADYKRRWENGYGYAPHANKKPTIFWNAIQKHGGIEAWDSNWKHEIIEDKITTLEEASNREKYWIAYYHTYINDIACQGYNMTPGGEGGQRGRIKLINIETNQIKWGHIDYLDSYLAEGFRCWTQLDYCKKWRANNKEKMKLANKTYYNKNKEKRKEQSRAYKAKQKMNMSEKDWEAYRLKHNEANRQYRAKKKK